MPNTASLIVSTVASRRELLGRSLRTWLQEPWLADIIIYDEDGSSQGEVQGAVRASAKSPWLLPRVRYLVSQSGPHGSHTHGYNVAASIACGSTLIFTHPEIMFPRSITGVVRSQIDSCDVMLFKPLWMPRQVAERYSHYQYMSVEELMRHDDMYPGGWNRDMVDPNRSWRSTTTFAISRARYFTLGGVNEWSVWGPDDPDFFNRVEYLGWKVKVVTEKLVLHQWHEESPTKEDDIKRAGELAYRYPPHDPYRKWDLVGLMEEGYQSLEYDSGIG